MIAQSPFFSLNWNKSSFRICLERIGRVFILLVYLLSLFGGSATVVKAATAITFTAEELLGKPTDTSITINIVPASTIEYHYQYGTSPGANTWQTPNVTAAGGQPHEVAITGLTANTKYYYRMRYHLPGETDWVERSEHTFQTQRAPGESFVFAVTSDSHATFNTAHQTAMTNVLNDQPDFLLDLGDTFYPASGTTTQSAVNNAYLAYRDPLYMDRIGHSVPIFLAAGNHEEEEGWNLDDSPFSIGVGSIQARKAYFPTPINDGFYSANTDTLTAINEATYGDELREDYYAWTWGDALFVVIDEFQYTMNLPYTPTAGEGSDDAVTGNQWSWTLGQTQYNWLKQTLENSDAKYKFVFSHHVTGGIPRDISVNPAGYVRGGAEAAKYFEWGGYNADGTWGFDTQRPGWGVPIHQLFVQNGVSAYFHGHDHQYVYETRDGVVYQEVPSPSMSGSGFSGIYTEGTYAEYSTLEMLPNSGYLRITVAPDEATVEYVRSNQTGVSHTYTIEPSVVTDPDYNITATAGANGSISPSGTVGVVAGANQSFTITSNNGYQVADVLVDGVSVGAVTGYTFTNVAGNHTIEASFETASASGVVTLDGEASSNTLASGSSVAINHTTGTGADRLMLVGLSYNSGSTARTVSSVTFTPTGGSTINLNSVVIRKHASQNRYSAIYSLLNPPIGQTGTVTITFSGSVSNGIMAGVANFAGVDQTTPLGTTNGTDGQSTAPSVTLTGLDGGELVFDNVFQGGQNSDQTLTVGSDQTQLWNPAYIANLRSASSTEQAVTSSVTMSWTAVSSSYWVIVAVPINPAPFSGTTYELTMASDGNGITDPMAGTHTYPEGTVVNIIATPNSGYVFDSWTGDADCTDGSVTMNANKSCTANFIEAPPTEEVTLDGAFSSGTGDVNATSVTFSHTTGMGMNRLMLVGVSWNSGTTNRTISSVTFTPDGGSAVNLTEIKTQEYTWTSSGSTNYRYAAIYGLVNPPGGVSGTVVANFSGTVSNGIVSGSANFAGVDQTTPLGMPGGAGGTSTGTPPTPTVNLTGLNGNELVFDTAFIGVSSASHTLTADSGQSALWNVTNYSSSNSFNTRGSASIEQAVSPSVTMSWTPGGYGSTATRWAIAAVPINPAPVGGTTYELTVAVDSMAGGTTMPVVGTHNYPENEVVNITATPALGYVFDHWSGDCSGAGDCSVTMSANRSVTAHFSLLPIPVTFTGSELLGRPTDTSVAISVVPDANISLYYEYGTTSDVYSNTTSTVNATGGQPQVVTITGLTADTKYYYRMRYSSDGGSTWTARSENSFQTQRAAGGTFTFDITSDSHIDIQLGTESNWLSTLNRIATDSPDFLIDLGDTVAMDNGSTSVPLGDIAAAEQRYKDALPYFNIVSGSSPIFLLAGNHEQQEAWHLTASNTGGDPAISLPVMGKNAEKKFFLNPVPGPFYTGNMGTYSYLSGDQLKQDYYAWTWGDALFVVISPFWTTTTKPYTTTAGGGETDTTGSGDRWDWTLGLDQFNWLKSTLQSSDARYKFVFSHQIVGGNGMTSPVNQVNYGHGGVDSANFVEWGGYNVDGTTWAWNTERPGWGSQPIRQMMEANGVTAFFHGHDHQMAYEKLNGMVYQSVPSGSFTGSFGSYTTGGNSGNTIWADSTQGPGHLRVTVGPTEATVDFVRYNASTPAYTYTMEPTGGPSHDLAVAVDPIGAGTTAPGVGSNSYVEGTVVDITATPAVGYVFDHWSGDCSGTGSCQVTMDADKSVTAHFTLINTAPVANDQSVMVTEDVAQGITLTASDAESNPLAFTVLTQPGHGSLTGTAPTLTYTPVENYSGVDSFTFKVNDGALDSNTATVSITISAVNDAPVLAVIGNKSVSEDVELAFTATATDADLPANTLTFSLSGAPAGANITSGGAFTWTPTEAQGFGEYSFDVVVTDGSVDDSETITVTVNEVNVAPDAASQNVNTDEDQVLPITLSATDGDLPPNTLTYGIVTPPAHGALSGTAPNLTYTPDDNYNGADAFTFKVNDGTTDSNEATVNISVAALNDAPVANPQVVSTDQNTPKDITLTGSDVEGSPLTYAIVTDPAHGALSGTAPDVTYTPDTGYVGADSFTFKVNDGTTDSAPATVTIQVTDVGVPVLPSSFYGEIHIYDNPPSVGGTVEAYLPDTPGVAANTTITDYLGELIYSIDVSAGDKGSLAEGDLITFKVDGRVVATALWHSGTNVRLDFHPPQALPGGPYTGVVGTPVSFTGSASDWGMDDTTYQWDWENDGTYDAIGKNVNHAWSAPGNYTVGLKVTDSQGGEGTGTATVSVDKAPATVFLSNLNQVYDGSPKSVTVTTDPAGLSVDVTYDGSYTVPTNADSYAVIATIDDPNYSGSISDTFVIQKAPSTTIISGGGSFSYDGDPHPASVSVTGVGGLSLSPDPVYTGACSAAPINVADTPCTASYTFAGDDNHTGSNDSVVITITPASATVTLGNLHQTYDGTPKPVTVVTDPAGLSIEVTYDGLLTPPTEVGSYPVVATVTDSNYTGSASETLVIEPATITHSIALLSGWNLISFNVHPVDTAVESVLSSVAGNYDLVYAWDATGASVNSGNWLKHDNIPFSTDTLTHLDETMGFWIHMTEADTLEVVGSVPTSTNIELFDNAGGWNLVAFPALGDQSLPAVLADHGVGADFSLVYAYHAEDSIDPWKLFDVSVPIPALNDLQSLSPGWGYWIKVSADHTWIVVYAP